MITLYGFGPAFGLPDPSPFVIKVEVLLKMAGLEFRTDANGFRKAPKRKLPYIDDGGTIVADSTFIRWHIGVSREGHAVMSVKVRPEPKDSGSEAREALWRESKTAEPSDNILERSMREASGCNVQ